MLQTGKCKRKQTSWQETVKKSVQYLFAPDFTLTWGEGPVCVYVCVILTWHKKPTVSFHQMCRVGFHLRCAATETLFHLQLERAASHEDGTSMASCSCCGVSHRRSLASSRLRHCLANKGLQILLRLNYSTEHFQTLPGGVWWGVLKQISAEGDSPRLSAGGGKVVEPE